MSYEIFLEGYDQFQGVMKNYFTKLRHTLRMRTHLSAKFKFSENTHLGPKFIA